MQSKTTRRTDSRNRRAVWSKAKEFCRRHYVAVGLAVIIILQTIVYLLAGIGKVYIHMDEAYSLALTHYDKIEITDNADFYNTWHDREYYQKYLAVQDDEKWDFAPVWTNQQNDVHPPLFYLFLRLAQMVMPNEFNKWPGIILNVIIYAGVAVLLYVVWQKVLWREKNSELKSLVLTLATQLTIASVSSVVYIRMYALLTLMVLLTLWLHLKLSQERPLQKSTLISISVVALLGVLTQYYYLFFLLPLYVVMMVGFVKDYRYREARNYTGVLAVAGLFSLVIWPSSIQHMFFSYRGQGALSNFLNLPELLAHVWQYLEIIDYNVFHRALPLILVPMLGLLVIYCVKSCRSKYSASLLSRLFQSRASGLKLIIWPTLVYFAFVAVASPFRELRYIMPITGLCYGLVMYGLYKILQKITPERIVQWIIMIVMLLTWLVAPVQLGMKWMRIELLYRDRQAVMQTTAEHASAPLLYFITTANNRYLDNILPFTVAEESYLVLDLTEPSVSEVRQILQGQDLSHGLMVWISDQQDHPETLRVVQEATRFTEVNFVQIVNTCTVYYLK